MTEATTPLLYDLVTGDRRSLSPWCWPVKMAIAHKNIAVETKPLIFSEKDQVIKAGGKTFPLLVETDGQIYDDSRLIIDHLEKKYPEPTLFPGGISGLSHYQLVFRYCQATLFPTLVSMILMDIPDVLDPRDKDYFITSREKRVGMPLADYCAKREELRPTLNNQLDPFRKAMAVGGFICGDAPAMSDYMLFGMLQWARVTSPFELYDQYDDIWDWMEKMLDLYDGLGRNTAKA